MKIKHIKTLTNVIQDVIEARLGHAYLGDTIRFTIFDVDFEITIPDAIGNEIEYKVIDNRNNN